jgi:hypothetical protein
MDTEDGSGQIRRWHGSKANPEEQRKEVSRTMGYKIRLGQNGVKVLTGPSRSSYGPLPPLRMDCARQ